MIRTPRAAGAAAALVGLVVLTGCSSSASETASSAATSAEASMASPVMSPVMPPVVLDKTATTAKATVGNILDINVDTLAGTTIDVDNPDLLEVTQAHETDGTQFNPSAKALKAGTAVITVTNGDNTTRQITVTITE